MTEPTDLPDLRLELMQRGLGEESAPADPMVLFDDWLELAISLAIHNANAMAVATADPAGRPSVRNVLLRGRFDGGLGFYTNYESRKGVELDSNPLAEVLFSWLALERQVRFGGSVSRMSPRRSDEYYATRERESRISAIASPQSRVVGSRAELEAWHADIETSLGSADPVRPAHWGGYLLIPDTIEFWQGRPHRLHDRLLYQRVEGRWTVSRLAP